MATRLPARIRSVSWALPLPVAVLILWTFFSRYSPVVIPSPGEVARVLIHPFRIPPNMDSPSLWTCTAVSLGRVFFGYGLGVLTAIPLGFVVARSETTRRMLMPTVEFIRPVSPIAWMPLAIVFFGFSSVGSAIYGTEAWRHDYLAQIQFAMIVIIWTGAFFPILLSTIHGAQQTRLLYLESARMLGASPRQLFLHVVFPSALPEILTGLRIGLGIAWRVIIAAEIFPGTRSGLGYMITTSHQVAQYEYAIACIIVIGLLGLGMNHKLQWLSARVEHWQSKER